VTRYMVAGYGGCRASGKADERWFWTHEQAEAEIKRRLQVRRLHTRARTGGRDWGTSERTWTHEGLEWRCVSSVDYRVVPKSSPDFDGSGGCTLYQMRAVIEVKVFVNPFQHI
jgi:hypothetical protein